MITIGDLTLNDVGRTEISIDWRGDTISGVVQDLRTDTGTLGRDLLVGGKIHPRGEKYTRVEISFTNFTISDLELEHPCEVIS